MVLGAQGGEHARPPWPAAARRRQRKVGEDIPPVPDPAQFGQQEAGGGQQRLPCALEGRRPRKPEDVGKAVGGRKAEPGRTHEGEEFQQVERPEPPRLKSAGRGRRMNDDRRRRVGTPGRLRKRQTLGPTVRSEPDRADRAGDKRPRLRYPHGALAVHAPL